MISVRSCHAQLKGCFILIKTSITLFSSMKNGVKLGNSSRPLTCLHKVTFCEHRVTLKASGRRRLGCRSGKGSCGVEAGQLWWKLEGTQALPASGALGNTLLQWLRELPSASRALFTTACYSLWPYVFWAVNSVFHNTGRKRQYSNREGGLLPSTLTITDFWLCPASPWGLKTSQV